LSEPVNVKSPAQSAKDFFAFDHPPTGWLPAGVWAWCDAANPVSRPMKSFPLCGKLFLFAPTCQIYLKAVSEQKKQLDKSATAFN
jgi:hypothetical protein